MIECALGGVANPAFSTPACNVGGVDGNGKLQLGWDAGGEVGPGGYCGHAAAGVYGMYWDVCVSGDAEM